MRKRKDFTDEEFASWEESVIQLEVYCTLKGWTEVTYDGARCCRIIGDEFYQLLAKHHRLFGINPKSIDTTKSCFSLLRDLSPIVFNSLKNELIERPRLDRENSARFVEVVGERLQSLEPESPATRGSPAVAKGPRHPIIRRTRERTS